MEILKLKSFNLVGFVILIGLVVEFSFPNHALACSGLFNSGNMVPATMSLNMGTRDDGVTLLGGWSSSNNAWLRQIDCAPLRVLTATPTSIQDPSEFWINDGGVNYDVYPTGVDNIGYYMVVVDDAGNSLALGQARQIQAELIRTSVRVRFVATGPLNAGSYRLPSLQVLRVNMILPGIDIVERVISYHATTVTVTGSTCTVIAADQNQTVVLPAVSSSSLQRVGSTAGSQSFTMGVNCPAGVALHATMTDVNDPANRSNVLTLAAESTAAGVGLQITATDRANVVSYGPDSRVAGNTNQWLVDGNANSPATNYRIPFTARYVQTAETVRPGTVRARSTITFSYQ
ncbi:fimbrial protein [Pseudomonas sp. GZD-222]|uniref:fimbrial protein n=1 Tax=Pseudomonas sp. GZD-222 TaxID=3404805 RepID=UPI003BB74332